MNSTKYLFKPALLASCISLAACGGSSDSTDPNAGTPTTPTTPTSTTFNFNVAVPSAFNSTIAPKPYGTAAKIDPNTLTASDIKVALVDSAGNVTEVVTPISFSIEPDGSYNLVLPGGLRVDCVILVDVDGTATLTLNQPLPTNALVAPTTSNETFDIDIQSTLAFQEFIESIPDTVNLATDSGFTPDQLQDIVDIVQEAELPSVGSGATLEEYLAYVFVDLESIIEREIEIIETIIENPDAANFNLAAYFIDNDGAFSWFDSENEGSSQNGLTNFYLDYGRITKAGETEYYYDPNSGVFVESNNTDDVNDLYLTSNGNWLEKDENANSFTANADGSIRGNNSATVDNVQRNDVLFDISAQLKLPVAGQSIKPYLLGESNAWAQSIGNAPVFSSGAEVFRVDVTEVNDLYQIWRYSNNGIANFSSAQNTVNDNLDNLAALQVQTASTSTDIYNGGMNLILIDNTSINSAYVEFVADGTLNIYTISNINGVDTAIKTGSATWVTETGPGNTPIMVIPRSTSSEGLFDDEDDAIIFVAYEVSTGVTEVVRGNKYNAGSKEGPFFLFNDTAKDDILANFNARRLELSCGYEADWNAPPLDSFTDFGVLVENCGGTNAITTNNLIGTWNENGNQNESVIFSDDDSFQITENGLTVGSGTWSIANNQVSLSSTNILDLWVFTPNGVKVYTEESNFPADLIPDGTADGKIWNGNYTKQTNTQSNSDGRFSMSSELSFGAGSTKATSYLQSINTDNIDQFSATVSVDNSSTVTSGARIETDITLMYQPLSNRNQGATNKYGIVLRLRNEGADTFIQSFMFLCHNEDCSNELYLPSTDDGTGQMINGTTIADWSSTATIEIDFNEPESKYTLFYNGQSIDVPISAFNNHADVQAAGITISTSESLTARIRTRVKGIDNDSESGQITAYYDDATINGVLVDDFSSDNLNTNIWESSSSNGSTTSLTCSYESGWDDNAFNGLGGPINPNSFADFETVVNDCGTNQAITFADIAGKAFGEQGETDVLAFNSIGSGTEADRSTGLASGEDFDIYFEWYIDNNGYLVLYTDTTIDADLEDSSLRVTWALTEVDGNNYSFIIYEEAARFGDMVRDTGNDGEIWNSIRTLQ